MKTRVLEILAGVDDRMGVHDFRMVPSGGHTNLIFDITLPCQLLGQEKSIKKELDRQLNDGSPVTYYTVVTFDPEAFNQ
jgi:hypothetical protein